ncbi:MAG: hypothetical protein Q8L48_27540 [Archangium sp.]|nr:hypothetical protein [Archangium sp.]
MKNVFIAAVLSVSFVAFAGEPELKPAQEEAKGKSDEALADPLKALNEKCGTKVASVKTDYENFKEADWSGTAFYSWCPTAIEAITSMCADRPAYKKALGKKLTGISCLFAGVKPKDKKDGSNEYTLRNMSFEKGVFVFRIEKDEGNIADNAKATLEKALN